MKISQVLCGAAERTHQSFVDGEAAYAPFHIWFLAPKDTFEERRAVESAREFYVELMGENGYREEAVLALLIAAAVAESEGN